MPGVRTHDIATVLAGGALGLGVYAMAPALPQLAVAAAAGCLVSGWLFSPDLDTDSTPYLRWRVLRVLWWPFKAYVPHRSLLSHGPGIGAAVILGYFLVVLTFLATVLCVTTGQVLAIIGAVVLAIEVVLAYRGVVIPFLVGFAFAHLVHVVLDWCVSEVKRSL